MAFIKTPMKGMPEYLPDDIRLREYLLGKIKKTYGSYGFSLVETPAVEHIENLTGKQGGENEKLIFKILKRGEKLASASGDDLCDGGLRYDLTLPLSRYYANNAGQLPTPFKAMQMGSVWRADRPQKGRFRQFTQCDIDILGDASRLAEIELITATTSMLAELGFEKFKVKVNDRRILKAMAAYSGFAAEEYDNVFIILDKIDKIGLDGVRAELVAAGYPEACVAKYAACFADKADGMTCAEFCAGELKDFIGAEIVDGLTEIIASAKSLVKAEGASIVFDPTLVRGMSYYTGPIFEIELPDFGSSVAGGGRYDEMIGKFTGQSTPACGFSIGFERIFSILKERGGVAGWNSEVKIAYLVDPKASAEEIVRVNTEAAAERANGAIVLVTPRKKNVKFQKDMLLKDGYGEFR